MINRRNWRKMAQKRQVSPAACCIKDRKNSKIEVASSFSLVLIVGRYIYMGLLC
jgi:hypothetical protein